MAKNAAIWCSCTAATSSALALRNDQPVCVRSEVGEIRGYLARAYDAIRPGNIMMYYPEANQLVPRTLDPQSKTPAFKCVPVSIEGLS